MVRRPVHHSSRTGVVALAAALALGLAGCSVGGGGADQAAIENAREQGAAQARLDERAREQRATNRELQRKVARLERRGGSSSAARSVSSGGSSGSSGGSSSSSSGGSTSSSESCGSGVTVSSATSCTFAGNVVSAYYDSGESSSIDVYSPVTGRSYTMSCSGSSPVSCSGGNGALVQFP